MLSYSKDDFDESFDDILNSVNGILKKKKVASIDDEDEEEEKDKNKSE